MAKQAPVEPEFEITLSNDQLRELGRFTATWSQIDFLLTQIVTTVCNTDPMIMLNVFLDNSTTGALLNTLRKLNPYLPNAQAKTLAQEITNKLGSLLDRRNHLIHGIWGLYWDFEKNKLKPACHYQRNAGKQIYAKEIASLADSAAKESLRVAGLLRIILPLFALGPRPFVFVGGDVPPGMSMPDWQRERAEPSAPPRQDEDHK